MTDVEQVITDILTAVERGQEIRLYGPERLRVPVYPGVVLVVEVLLKDEDDGRHLSHVTVVNEMDLLHVGTAVLGYAIATASDAIEKVASEEPYELEVE